MILGVTGITAGSPFFVLLCHSEQLVKRFPAKVFDELVELRAQGAGVADWNPVVDAATEAEPLG